MVAAGHVHLLSVCCLLSCGLLLALGSGQGQTEESAVALQGQGQGQGQGQPCNASHPLQEEGDSQLCKVDLAPFLLKVWARGPLC